MLFRNNRSDALGRGFGRALVAAAAMLPLHACAPDPVGSPVGSDETAVAPAQRPRLGVMTSLPLYWGEGAGVADLAAGRTAVPWQRAAMEQDYALVPLDTLTPIPALSPNAPEVDPLAGLARLAVVQPRGLSPADNVALDAWVRGGGRLLLVLDPALTGDYAALLGDPRRPVDAARIPPVVARWGMAVSFDAAQGTAGRIAITNPAADCRLVADSRAATCTVGKGRVALIAEAAQFEHRELAGKDGAALRAVLATALE